MKTWFPQNNMDVDQVIQPLTDLIEQITSSLDQAHCVVSLFFDLGKAFDTVNH